MTLPLATHGYITKPSQPVYVDTVHPDTETEEVRPEIMSKSTAPPKLKIEGAKPDVRPTIRPRRNAG